MTEPAPEQTPPQVVAELTPESAAAIADKVIESVVIPKKFPAFDDIEGQTKAMAGGLASAMLTATDVPLHELQPVVNALASQLVAFGFRQTEHVDPSAVHAPAWIVDGVRQESVTLPDPPRHTEGEPFVAGVAEAPKCPKRIKKAHRAVRRREHA